MKKLPWVYILLGIIFLFGMYIRLQSSLSGTFAFTYDVGRDMLQLAQIIETHKLPLIGPTTGLPGLFYGPWWYYLLLPAFIIAQGNPIGVAVFMNLVGGVAILCAYVLGKEMENSKLGLFFAGLVAFSSATISASQQIWNPNIADLFVVLVLLLLILLYKKSLGYISYFFLGLLLAMTIDSEVVFGLLYTAGVILSMVLLLRKKVSRGGVLFMLLGAFIIFSPRMFFEVRHHFVMTTHIVQMLHGSQPSGLPPVSFLHNFLQRVVIFWDSWNFALNSFWPLTVLSFIAIIMSLQQIFSIKKQTSVEFVAKLFGIVFLVFFVGVLVFQHDIFSHYLVALPVYFLLWSGLAFYLLLKRYFKGLVLSGILVLLVVILCNPVAFVQSFFAPVWVGDVSVYRNQVHAVDYIYQKAQGKPFRYETYTPARIDYEYQYLFAWYGKDKYKYTPVGQAPLVFFIFETDENQGGAWYWKVAREKSSRMTDRIVLPGGITVQTREAL
ncbi:MAG: hypothetical protein KGJ07_04795 [Patescibacteria group bacterium]|nr:hypothetical protein [Patescibacteria group bacterium]